MNDRLPFPNAPITEAIIDIRTELSSELNLDVLASYQEQIKDRFPVKKERYSWRGGFQFGKGAEPKILQPSGGPDGYLFKSTDGKKIVQARLDGFSFNKLKPYEEWKVFSKEAKELWALYVQIVKPIKVTRLALRYINRIEIPLPIKKLKEYILTLPEIAKGLPSSLGSYFMSLEIREPKIDARATIIGTFKPVKADSKILPLIFDIDVYKLTTINPIDKSIWIIMDQLRTFKNDIFFKSLTNKTKEMFK